MSLKEIFIGIIIPLISGFFGGSIGSILIIKNSQKNNLRRELKNKNTKFENVGEIVNGDKIR